MRKTELRIVVLAVAAVFSMPAAVMAGATTMTGTANFLDAIALTPTGLSFGNILWAAAPGGGDTVTLKTDGTMTYAGTFSNGGGTKTAGNVHAVGSGGTSTSVYCDASTTLGNGSGVTIALDQIKVADAADVATGGVACAGLGTAVYNNYTLNVGGDDFKIGARINGGSVTGTFVSGTYTTTQGAGDINVIVVSN